MPGTFEMSLNQFSDDVQADLTEVVKKVALDLYGKIAIKTPVDTGRARGNWIVAVGHMPRGTIDRVTSAPLVSEALAILADYDALSEMDIYIVNNLAYIQALEHGHSKQAPAGMVAITLTEFKGIVKKAARKTP